MKIMQSEGVRDGVLSFCQRLAIAWEMGSLRSSLFGSDKTEVRLGIALRLGSQSVAEFKWLGG